MRRLIALALLLAPASAAAAPHHSLTMARVELRDLDVHTAAGAAEALRRIAIAARAICAPVSSPLFPHAGGQAWRCRREAVAAAVARLATPDLRLAYATWLSADPDADPQARVPGDSPSSRKEEGAS
jgi:UrcA family protein